MLRLNDTQPFSFVFFFSFIDPDACFVLAYSFVVGDKFSLSSTTVSSLEELPDGLIGTVYSALLGVAFPKRTDR